MEQIKCENLSFTYPEAEKKALDNISFSVKRGEFVVLCGESGSGKTTLLRHLKSGFAPAGEKSGEVFFNGRAIDALEPRLSAEKAGYVSQDPDSQIVTDRVWHELAFGQENIGRSPARIRLRTAEMSAYFGISEWYGKKTDELSGGQKQLLNLAAVMVMGPELLILDEPTSQLDPVTASGFLATVSRLNREFGITVIITEHRLEDALGYADRAIVMQAGRIIADCRPDELAARAESFGEFVRLAMPTAVRVFSALGEAGDCPLNVSGAARRLTELVGDSPAHTRITREERSFDKTALKLKNISFRYEKHSPDVLKELDLEVPRGCVFAIMGGNGAGKSTLLNIIAGLLKPYSGKIAAGEKGDKPRIAMLPQNVQTLFTRSTVKQELEGAGEDHDNAARLAGLEPLSGRHPYDLSGGEQQRLALGMVLSRRPDILLLDEPTKGMDVCFKQQLSQILRSLAQGGKTVIMVSHDVEFCSRTADLCCMLFDSDAAAVRKTDEFFADNFFYTTAANRMSRHIFENCVTDKDVIALCRKNMKPRP